MNEHNDFRQEMQDKFRELVPDYSQPPQPEEFRIGFGRRLGAYLIDFVIYMFLLVLAMSFFGILDDFASLMTIGQDFGDNPEELQIIMKDLYARFYPLVLVIAFAYYSMEIFFAQTVGKMVLGIKIANSDRTQASLGTLVKRFVAKYFNYFLLLLYIITNIEIFSIFQSIFGIVIFIGCFLVLSQSRMALHDHIAKTAVFFKDEILPDEINKANSINI
ncbi:MAG TPA: RDD family protein [Candidatus Kapabacteria bacterium]|nr:RDD family protein [Candidatus Kapabacteria bacterium]HPU23134.1 RDD family protein [Candidatus Kapabacteria bacterium]